MILSVHQRLRAAIAARLTEIYGLAPAEQPVIAIDYAPSRALGDLAVPVAFELARRLRKAPRAIAQELATSLGAVDGFARIEATPSGYLNCFLDRAAFLTSRLRPQPPMATASPWRKVKPDICSSLCAAQWPKSRGRADPASNGSPPWTM